MSTQGIPEPRGVALIVCGNVYTDSHGKKALTGLFNEIGAVAFPAIHSRMCVLVSVTSLRPQTMCELSIVHSVTDQAIFSMDGPLPSDDPVQIYELVFELEGVTFPEAGTYFVRFSSGGVTVLERPIVVRQVNQNPTPEGANDDDKT